MTSNKELELKIQRLEAKVFHNQDLNIDTQLKELTARQHAEHHDKDDKHHFLGVRNLDSAKQKIESFKNQFDKGAVNSLHGNEIIEYEMGLNLVNELAIKWKLPKIWDMRDGKQ